MTEHQAVLFCTFCERPQTAVEVLITAPDGTAAICDGCLDLAVDVIDLWKQDRLAAAARAKEEAEWREREANPVWQKGLHNFAEPHEDTNSSDL